VIEWLEVPYGGMVYKFGSTPNLTSPPPYQGNWRLFGRAYSPVQQGRGLPRATFVQIFTQSYFDWTNVTLGRSPDVT